MLIHRDDRLTIFFGNQEHKFVPAYFRNLTSEKLIEQDPFSSIKNELALGSYLFLHQVHGTAGTIIRSRTHAQKLSAFSTEGDFIITHLARIGIGIATADCLPIIFYDPVHGACAIIHAGWRGAVQGIALQALNTLQQEYQTETTHLKVFFGPSARVCCYQVDEQFVIQLPPAACRFLLYTNNQIFFDLTAFNKELLIEAGVQSENIITTYNYCTICNESFCSYRRQNKTVYRQMTIAYLT